MKDLVVQFRVAGGPSPVVVSVSPSRPVTVEELKVIRQAAETPCERCGSYGASAVVTGYGSGDGVVEDLCCLCRSRLAGMPRSGRHG